MILMKMLFGGIYQTDELDYPHHALRQNVISLLHFGGDKIRVRWLLPLSLLLKDKWTQNAIVALLANSIKIVPHVYHLFIQ